MTTAAFPGLIDAMVATFSAATELTSLQVRTFDGPEIDDSYPNSILAIGHDGSEDGDVQAASLRNSYDQVGAKRMFEDGSINCMLAAFNGDTKISTCRTLAYQIMSAVDTVIRKDPSFSGACLYAGLEIHNPIYRQTNAGAVVIVNFTIAYRART